MRRPVLQLIAVGAVAAVPACGFPSVTFDATPADGAADGQEQRDATGADSVSPVDGQVGSDGGLDALVGDGASADAMPSADGPADGPANCAALAFSRRTIRFVPARDGRTGIVAVDVHATDRERVAGQKATLCSTLIRFV